MKPNFIFWIFRPVQYAAVSLVAVLAISSCAPAVTSAPAVPTASEAAAIPATATQVDSSPAPEATAVVPILAAATSRGPNLEATDPASVSLASGQLQLIEFFRFT